MRDREQEKWTGEHMHTVDQHVGIIVLLWGIFTSKV